MTVWDRHRGPFNTVGGHDPTSSSEAGNDNARFGLPVTLTNSPNHGTFRVIRPLADHINGPQWSQVLNQYCSMLSGRGSPG